jgi:hypothetical protein
MPALGLDAPRGGRDASPGCVNLSRSQPPASAGGRDRDLTRPDPVDSIIGMTLHLPPKGDESM